MTVLEEIDSIKHRVVSELSQAAKTTDVAKVELWSNRLVRLASLSKKAALVVDKLSSIKAEIAGANAGGGPSLRKIEIRVTGGMKNQHMLIVTPYLGQIEYGEEMVVTAPRQSGQGTFTTEFVKSGNRLRARGPVRAFFENRVKVGDIVVLFETAPGKWALETKAKYEKLVAAAGAKEPEPAIPAPVTEIPPLKAAKSRPPPVKAGTPISEA